MLVALVHVDAVAASSYTPKAAVADAGQHTSQPPGRDSGRSAAGTRVSQPMTRDLTAAAAGSPYGTATSGDGGPATVTPTTGDTGPVDATDVCTLSLGAADAGTPCHPLALATSGASGVADGTAAGGPSGPTTATAITRVRGGLLVRGLHPTVGANAPVTSTAVAGAGGTASVSVTSGGTGTAVSTATCSFTVSLTDVTVDGTLTFACSPHAVAVSGASGGTGGDSRGGAGGVATASAGGSGGPGGTAGGRPAATATATATADAALATVTATVGHPGTSSAAAGCSFGPTELPGVTVDGGALTFSCTPTHAATDGKAPSAPLPTRTGTRSASGQTSATAPVTVIGVLGMTAVAVVPASATSGAGGTATFVAVSGDTGDARASATCLFTITTSNVVVHGTLQFVCLPDAVARTGDPGTTDGTAAGGVPGLASATAVPDGEDPSGLPGATPASALGGAGGAATEASVSGRSGEATATARCDLQITLGGLTVSGDTAFACAPEADATSGASGAATGIALGGGAGAVAAVATVQVDAGSAPSGPLVGGGRSALSTGAGPRLVARFLGVSPEVRATVVSNRQGPALLRPANRSAAPTLASADASTLTTGASARRPATAGISPRTSRTGLTTTAAQDAPAGLSTAVSAVSLPRTGLAVLDGIATGVAGVLAGALLVATGRRRQHH